MLRHTTCILAVMLLTACSSAGPQRVAAIDRALAGAPGQAQPSAVIATEVAAARAVREYGQLTTLLDFAAPGAVLHLAGGLADAQSVLSRRSYSTPPVRVLTRVVWMSCDGQAAVSSGNYVSADGRWGRYAAAWQRQPAGDYRWTYGIAAPDPALTAREARARPVTADDAEEIVVEGTTMIRGETGDCLRGAPPPPPAPGAAADGGGYSPDNTLAWRWLTGADGTRSLIVTQHHAAGWEQVFTLEVGSDGEVSAFDD